MCHIPHSPPPVSLQPPYHSSSLIARSKAIKRSCELNLKMYKSEGNSRRYALCVDYPSPSPVSLQPLYRSSSLIARLKANKNTYQHNLRSYNTAGNSPRLVQRVLRGQSMVDSSPQCVSMDLNTNRGPIAKSRVKTISRHESKGRARRYPHLFFMDPAKAFAA